MIGGLAGEGIALARKGSFAKARRYLLSAYRKAGDEETKAGMLYHLAYCYGEMEYYSIAEDIAGLSMRHTRKNRQKIVFLMVDNMLKQGGKTALAGYLADGLYVNAGTDGEKADIASLRAMTAYFDGRTGDAVKEVGKAAELYRKAGNSRFEAVSRIHLGYYRFRRDGDAGFLKDMTAALECLRETDHDFIDIIRCSNMIYYVQAFRNYGIAEAELLDNAELCEEGGHTSDLFFCYYSLFKAAGERNGKREEYLGKIRSIWKDFKRWSPERAEIMKIFKDKNEED